MANRVIPLAAVLLAIISTLTQDTSAASIDNLKACPVGEVPECKINIEYKTLLEKYPHPYNCDWYFYCSDGVPYCLQCEEGTIYNPETERCDNTVRVGCIVETTPAPTTPPPPPTTPPPTTTTIPPPPPPTTTTAPTTRPPPPPTTTTTRAPTTRPPQSSTTTTTTAHTTRPPQSSTTTTTTAPTTRSPPPLPTTTAPTTRPPLPQTTPPPPTTTALTTPSSTIPPPTSTTQPTAAPTTLPPIVPPEDLEPKCPACARDGPTFRHPTNCQWFYECTNGIPVLRQCVGGLHWNARLQVCDFPCLAGCSVESQSTPVGVVKPDGGETTVCPAAEAPACPAQDPRMAVLLAHPTSCEWYFECSNGIPYCMPCPAGEHFNPKLKVCDYPDHAGCGAADVIPNTNVEPPKEDIPSKPEPSSGNDKPPHSIQQPDPQANDVKNVCPAVQAPACPAQDPRMAVLLVHPTSCEWYFECSNGIPYCMPCPAGEHFNPILKVCDYPEHAGCGSVDVIPKDNEEPPKEEKLPEKEIKPYPVEPKSETPSDVIPDDNEQPSKEEKLPEKEIRPYPEEPKPETSANNVKNICPAVEAPACPTQDPRMAVLLAHPTSCEWYFECSNGIPYCMPCPIGEYFNPKLKVCDYPENSGCVASSGTVQETESRNEITTGVGNESGPKTVSKTGSGSRTENEVQTVCPAVESPSCSSQDPRMAVLAHPTTCSWYFQCSNGIPYCMPCPAGLYFNDELKVCDYPEKSGCKISN